MSVRELWEPRIEPLDPTSDKHLTVTWQKEVAWGLYVPAVSREFREVTWFWPRVVRPRHFEIVTADETFDVDPTVWGASATILITNLKRYVRIDQGQPFFWRAKGGLAACNVVMSRVP